MVMKSLPYQGIARMSEEQLKAWHKKIEREYGIKIDPNGEYDHNIDVSMCNLDGYNSPRKFNIIEGKNNVR